MNDATVLFCIDRHLLRAKTCRSFVCINTLRTAAMNWTRRPAWARNKRNLCKIHGPLFAKTRCRPELQLCLRELILNSLFISLFVQQECARTRNNNSRTTTMIYREKRKVVNFTANHDDIFDTNPSFVRKIAVSIRLLSGTLQYTIKLL